MFLKEEVEHLMKLHNEWKSWGESVYKREMARTDHMNMAGRFK